MASQIEPSCAICGYQTPDCKHESESLKLAVDQATQGWLGLQAIRDWVIAHARHQVSLTFRQLREARYQAHVGYLQTLPCYTIYQRYNGVPPIAPHQQHYLQVHIQQANHRLRTAVDEDWRRCCLEYPRILDYYFSLVDLRFPDDHDPALRYPRFGGGAVKGSKRANQRKNSGDSGITKEHRKEDRRRSRGRAPPPAVPMPGPLPGHHRR